ncbi:hypothetical protein Tco_0397743 [Tanacetum coccineum]
MAGVDVDTLTIEQYLALSRENQAPGVVKREIGGNVNFEIKSQFMHELREDTFFGNKDEDAHDHIDRVLNIIGLFNIPGVSKDGSCSEFFPLLLPDSQNDGYCPPFVTAKQLEDIHNFKQEGDESLYQAWERMTSRSIRSYSSKDRLAALVNKLDNLGRDMKKLKESVHTIQVGCQICEGPHLDKDCPLNKEVKQVEEVRYGVFGRTMPFNGNNGGKFPLNLHEEVGGVIADHGTSGLNKLHEVSFISGPESYTPEVLQHQLPPKELNPGSFTFPCTIGKFNFYATADLGASINVMPMSILKRSRDDCDKDRDPSAGSDRGKKRRKSSKDAECSRDSRSKEKKSSSTSKDAFQSQHKSSRKSAQAEEPSHTVEDSSMQQDQEF